MTDVELTKKVQKGYAVSVSKVSCEFGKTTGWQAVMTIYGECGPEKTIYNTVWCDEESATIDADQMFEHADMFIN